MERIDGMLRSKDPGMMELGVIAALETLSPDDIGKVIPWFAYLQSDGVEPIFVGGNLPSKIYIKGNVGVVISATVFYRTLPDLRMIHLYNMLDKIFL